MAGAPGKGEPWPENNLLHPRSDWFPGSFHAYVHVPFCRVRCGYCDFNTYVAAELRGANPSTFEKTIISEIAHSARVLNSSGIAQPNLSSIFFGGGTPTLFETAQLSRVIDSLRDHFGLQAGAEVTVEANPDTVYQSYLERLASSGVTRVSFGVQSFDPKVLATLDRTHDPKAVPLVVAAAKRAGLQVSVDLIYGTPGESIESWRTSVESALALETDHISAYSLIVEPGTKLAAKVRRGELPDIDADFHADCYQVADELLASAGFRWYEVSNWARSASAQSVHNQAYWQSRDWWGYGPGAHSHIAGTRWWNAKHPASYQKLLETGGSPAVGVESISTEQALEERVLLELRTARGLPLQVLRDLGVSQRQVSHELADGLLRLLPGNFIAVTDVGRLTADAIVVRLLTSH